MLTFQTQDIWPKGPHLEKNQKAQFLANKILNDKIKKLTIIIQNDPK